MTLATVLFPLPHSCLFISHSIQQEAVMHHLLFIFLVPYWLTALLFTVSGGGGSSSRLLDNSWYCTFHKWRRDALPTTLLHLDFGVALATLRDRKITGKLLVSTIFRSNKTRTGVQHLKRDASEHWTPIIKSRVIKTTNLLSSGSCQNQGQFNHITSRQICLVRQSHNWSKKKKRINFCIIVV